MKSTPIAVLFLLTVVPTLSAAPASKACVLPKDLQKEIAATYPGSRLVRLSDLDRNDRQAFLKDHGRFCPSANHIDFYGDGNPTWALVLIGAREFKDKAAFVLAHRVRSLET